MGGVVSEHMCIFLKIEYFRLIVRSIENEWHLSRSGTAMLLLADGSDSVDVAMGCAVAVNYHRNHLILT